MPEIITNLDIKKILELLPHRYPFLLVDRVLELTPKKEIITLKNVTFNEDFFQGHFPGQPVMPGVLILEALAQSGGLMAYKSYPEEFQNRLFYFMGMDKVKFRNPVFPGDQLIMKVTTQHFSSRAVRMYAEATVDGKVVTHAEITAVSAPKS